MAIDSEIRTGIVQLSVVMLGRAPGSRALHEYLRTVEGGVTLAQLAEQIAATPLFNNIFSESLSNSEFADAFLERVFGGEVTPEIHELAVELVTAILDEGQSRGSVAYLVTKALADIGPGHPAYEDFADAIARFDNRVAVAEHWSVNGYDWRPSYEVLWNVTSDVSTRDAAIFAIDNPPPPPPPGETFELTASVDYLTGTAGDDTFIAEDAFTFLDRIDAGDGDDVFEVLVSEGGLEIPSTARIFNLEWLKVRANGAIKGDLGFWEGLELVQLNEVGNEEYPQGKLAIDLNANGTHLSARGIDGDVYIADALTVALHEVSSTSDVNIASMGNTEIVKVEGGRDTVIGARFEENEGARFVTGQSETVGQVTIESSPSTRFKNFVETVTIMSNAIWYLALTDNNAQINVINDSEQPVDLTMRLFEYKNRDAPAEVILSGAGAAETVEIRLEPRARLDPFPSGPFRLYGSSNFTLRDDAIRTVHISGPILVPDGDAFTWIGTPVSGGFTTLYLSVTNENGEPSTTLEHITVGEAGALALDATQNAGLKSIDASAASGNNDLAVAGEIVESVSTGSGRDTVVFTGTANPAGTRVSLGKGDDTLLADFMFAADSVIDGGDGFDILKLADRSSPGLGNDPGERMFRNFESLDISNFPGEFDMATLGFRHLRISSNVGEGVVLENMGDEDVTVTILGAVVESLAVGDGAGSGRLNLNLVMGEQGLRILGSVLNELSVNAAEGISISSEGYGWPYRNRIVNLKAESLRTLTISGDGYLEIGNRLDTVTHVDALRTTGGVTLEAGGDVEAVTFLGGFGNDYFIGGSGDDFIFGGLEADLLTGGAGSDTFRYLSGGDSRLSLNLDLLQDMDVDVITDFEIGADIISFSEGLGIDGNDLSGSNAHLAKVPIEYASESRVIHRNVLDYIGDGEGFFSDDGGNHLVATAGHGDDLFVFIDLDRSGNFELAADMTIILIGIGQDEFTTDIFTVG